MVTLLTILPTILILLVTVFNDRFKEPASIVLTSFGLGIAICLPAGFLNAVLIWSQSNPEDFTFLAAVTEEPLKFLVILLFLKNRADFNEPMDAIVYGTVVSLGFATLENFQYVFSLASAGEAHAVAALRAVSAIPMHASCGVIMGYYFGNYVFSGSKASLLKSLLVPILFHGAYNFVVNYSLGVGLIIIVFMILICDQLHRKVRRVQQLKTTEAEVKRA